MTDSVITKFFPHTTSNISKVLEDNTRTTENKVGCIGEDFSNHEMTEAEQKSGI